MHHRYIMLINAYIHQSFKAFPLASLLLEVDTPNFTIVDANDALLQVSGTQSTSLLIGKSIFEAFPDNPEDVAANGVSKLRASLYKTVETGIAQDMPPQKYDIAVPNSKRFEVKYWSVMNIPLFNDDGSVGCILHTTIDITDKILVEQKELEIEILVAQKKIILEHTESTNEIGSWNLNLETDEFLWSPEFYKICGYTPNAFTPSLEKAMEVIHPDDLEKVSKVYNDATEKGSPYRIEHRIIRPDGEVILVLATGIVIKNTDGKPILLTGLFQNITSNKQIESMLRHTVSNLIESEKKYKQLFENNPSPVYVWDFKTLQILDCNQEALLLYGYTKAEFLQLNLRDITPTPDAELIETLTKNVEDFSKINKKVWRHKKKNGDILYVYIVGHLFEQNNSKVILVSLNDVTEKMKTEEALKESELRYRSFFENSLDAHLLTKNDGKIMAANQMASKVFGYTVQELCELSISQLADMQDPRLLKLMRDKEAVGSAAGIHRMFHNSGAAFDVFMHSNIYLDANGEERSAVIIKDLSEQTKAEQALIDSEKKYRLLFYQSPIPKWIYEIGTFKIIDVNEAAIQHYGYSRKEFLNLTILDLCPKEEVHKLFSVHDKSNPNDALHKAGKFTHKKKNGSILTVEISSILLDFEGKKCKLIVANDISDIEQALKELALSNERYYYITKATTDAIWDWDLENDKTFWGDGFKDIFGYNINTIAKDTSFILNNIHPEDKQKVVDEFYKIVVGDHRNWQEEYRFKKADDTYAYVINKIIIIKNDAGKTIRIVGSMKDITANKKEVLRLQLLESVITNTSDMVIITEAELKDGIDQQIIYVNEAFTTKTGYTPEEVVGKTPRILQGPKTDRLELDKLKACLKSWQTCNITVINYTKTGEEFWVNMSVSPVADANGWFTHFISIERDITERVQHESEIIKTIIKTQEEERYDIGSELHDNVCQILTTSKIAFKMLEKNLPENKLPLFNDGIETLNLAFKEIRNLSHRLAPVFFDDNTLEQAFGNTLKAFNADNRYKMILQFDDAFKDYPATKEFQLNLHRILQEQLNNILKYAKASTIAVEGFIKNNQLVLSIRDDGIGFNNNKASTGIGLSNMKRRAELFNGKLVLDTAPGKGCKLSVEIPLKDVK